ncbi:MAG: hypothetical protein JRI36_13335 [Deltaproteobacteria bacterium]|nr:hypothetical protein [Deltaproteobacteria bacterium]
MDIVLFFLNQKTVAIKSQNLVVIDNLNPGGTVVRVDDDRVLGSEANIILLHPKISEKGSRQ